MQKEIIRIGMRRLIESDKSYYDFLKDFLSKYNDFNLIHEHITISRVPIEYKLNKYLTLRYNNRSINLTTIIYDTKHHIDITEAYYEAIFKDYNNIMYTAHKSVIDFYNWYIEYLRSIHNDEIPNQSLISLNNFSKNFNKFNKLLESFELFELYKLIFNGVDVMSNLGTLRYSNLNNKYLLEWVEMVHKRIETLKQFISNFDTFKRFYNVKQV
jgi:hypothetical protein